MNENLKEYLRTDNRYNSTSTSLYFRTQSLEQLKPLADLFLDESGKKVIPKNIGDYLTPRSLAFWIMDDGQQVKKGGVTLCTDSYNSEEINILREAIKANFNVETSIHKKEVQILFMKESILKKIAWRILNLHYWNIYILQCYIK
jgi:hypothetical protein